jgi:hypothetical protein
MWRSLTLATAPRVPLLKARSSQEGSLKRKKVSNEQVLREQLEKLQIELRKSKEDKGALETMMMEGDKSRAFLNEQLKSRDVRIMMLEMQLGKDKAAMEEFEKESGRLSLNWIRSSSELKPI